MTKASSGVFHPKVMRGRPLSSGNGSLGVLWAMHDALRYVPEWVMGKLPVGETGVASGSLAEQLIHYHMPPVESG